MAREPIVKPTPDFQPSTSPEGEVRVKQPIPCDKCSKMELCNIHGCQGSTIKRLKDEWMSKGLALANQLTFAGTPLTDFSRAELLAIAAMAATYSHMFKGKGHELAKQIMDPKERRDRTTRRKETE